MSTEPDTHASPSPQPIPPGPSPGIPDFSLANKVTLVSGAGRGLGLTLAEALLEAGAKVYALDSLPEPAPEFIQVQQRAKTWHTELQYRRVDVRDTGLLYTIIEDIANHERRIDGLVAAAAIQQETSALEYSANDSNALLEVNVTGVFMTVQAVARQMVRFGKGGSIAIVASMSGTVANRGLISPVYNASKAAVVQLARSLAAEWGQYNIRVNTLSPGYVLTPMLEMLFVEYPERREQFAKGNMLGRLSNPVEYRGAAVFLLSNASSFMTGSDLRIDGGHTAW
ncbi:Short-chain dehydrogenase/reductase SDR [Penicillium cf. griseofulvum]|uniref:Short-chain dehydrogenase/reductase SDR n=1 Tax=Penicillium cf. griseofulvum TaxID=2972120 RepID=A0A9W9J1E2_9EURO|nr:Short-chain dehydrogenase/reductase SDR [Penicillium cf. griseofulvum]KAJ5436866.1 Short-chain dehydrogenase/reductase SDR [Penicillium cf. griseofulvum]